MEADSTTGLPASPSPEHLLDLRHLLDGYRVSQAIYVMATLGIADLLKDGSQESADLARATGSHAGALDRVLRFLAAVGLFREVAPHRFALTALGAGLRTDVPNSVHPAALNFLDPSSWQSWGELRHSVRTGETAFRHVHGQDRFDYLLGRPDLAAAFNATMTSDTAQSGTAIIQAYDFSGIGRLVDVGGGHGLLLATILRAYPTLRGVLFDQPEVVAGAAALLAGHGVADRCEIVGGDFFAAVTPGGDAYILRQIIHDWDDAQALAILTNCRRAMGPDGRLLVVERVIEPGAPLALSVLHLDMLMLVNLGGRERTAAEYGALFAAAGFGLTTMVPLGDVSLYHLFEALPV
jgi:hypothetical protein